MKSLHVELKICEACGSLWFRQKDSRQVYCAGCSYRLSQFPQPRSLHAGGRPRRRTTRASHRCNGGAQ